MNRFISTLLIITIIALTGTCIHFYLSSKKMQLEIADNIIETQNAEAEALQLQKKNWLSAHRHLGDTIRKRTADHG